ncbi:formate dehydrogenase family accessory protein FdhD [Deinococcus aerius]|uniref:Sulfur carrier protein FdhD n=1 Tax=Deinococcus aerius TaxID=200253 RepID=A0A2I9D709_9DEIO|nr:formate dehydrogenase accessory sulfurtransferase FdhD [Deinococcus aerius]GBF06240.1 formate dehydrogenase family accessory protein FdhD [Deinococcus aerius]
MTTAEPASRPVLRYADGAVTPLTDQVAVEEPLELRLVRGGEERPLGVTMRTPGADHDLARGFLYAEGAIRDAQDVLGLWEWREGDLVAPNVLRVELRSGFAALDGLSRHTFTSSACGICGTGSIERLALRASPAVWTRPPLDPAVVGDLPARLRAAQPLFEATGGLHAAGLFTPGGECLAVREDVGRHNAVDKLIGWALGQHRLPLSDHLLVVSSRAGFEIVQKAALAGIPVVCAVSAPTSLAIKVAESFGLTLLGFVREGRFNVYSFPERLRL